MRSLTDLRAVHILAFCTACATGEQSEGSDVHRIGVGQGGSADRGESGQAGKGGAYGGGTGAVGTGAASAGGTTGSSGAGGSGASGVSGSGGTTSGDGGTAGNGSLGGRPPDDPVNASSKLSYAYYEGSWDSVPDFSQLTPVKSGEIATFDFSPKEQTSTYGFQFNGYVEVPSRGNYTFYTESDDGSLLYIGDRLIVDNDLTHPRQERSGQIELQVGLHAIRVEFFQGHGDEYFDVKYEGPGIAKQSIPASALYH